MSEKIIRTKQPIMGANYVINVLATNAEDALETAKSVVSLGYGADRQVVIGSKVEKNPQLTKTLTELALKDGHAVPTSYDAKKESPNWGGDWSKRYELNLEAEPEAYAVNLTTIRYLSYREEIPDENGVEVDETFEGEAQPTKDNAQQEEQAASL